MSQAGVDEGGAGVCGDSAKHLEDKDDKGGRLLSKVTAVTGWTKVSCPCCVSAHVEPLVLVKLGPKVGPETKRWLMKMIGAPQKDGGGCGLRRRTGGFCVCVYTKSYSPK